ncbi:hypothetical protein FRC12_000529 [Ceratobasidium sp. 428]|nr:hypothetical protein FRC12_000529 [Ceratobasidium sp. 428]
MSTSGYIAYLYKGRYYATSIGNDSFPGSRGNRFAVKIPRDATEREEWIQFMIEQIEQESAWRLERNIPDEEQLGDDFTSDEFRDCWFEALHEGRLIPFREIYDGSYSKLTPGKCRSHAYWTYVVDFDSRAFTINGLMHFRLDNMPPGDINRYFRRISAGPGRARVLDLGHVSFMPKEHIATVSRWPAPDFDVSLVHEKYLKLAPVIIRTHHWGAPTWESLTVAQRLSKDLVQTVLKDHRETLSNPDLNERYSFGVCCWQLLSACAPYHLELPSYDKAPCRPDKVASAYKYGTHKRDTQQESEEESKDEDEEKSKEEDVEKKGPYEDSDDERDDWDESEEESEDPDCYLPLSSMKKNGYQSCLTPYYRGSRNFRLTDYNLDHQYHWFRGCLVVFCPRLDATEYAEYETVQMVQNLRKYGRTRATGIVFSGRHIMAVQIDGATVHRSKRLPFYCAGMDCQSGFLLATHLLSPLLTNDKTQPLASALPNVLTAATRVSLPLEFVENVVLQLDYESFQRIRTVSRLFRRLYMRYPRVGNYLLRNCAGDSNYDVKHTVTGETMVAHLRRTHLHESDDLMDSFQHVHRGPYNLEPGPDDYVGILKGQNSEQKVQLMTDVEYQEAQGWSPIRLQVVEGRWDMVKTTGKYRKFIGELAYDAERDEETYPPRAD